MPQSAKPPAMPRATVAAMTHHQAVVSPTVLRASSCRRAVTPIGQRPPVAQPPATLPATLLTSRCGGQVTKAAAAAVAAAVAEAIKPGSATARTSATATTTAASEKAAALLKSVATAVAEAEPRPADAQQQQQPMHLRPAELTSMPVCLGSSSSSSSSSGARGPNSSASTHPPRRRVLCYGDSLTAGFYAGGQRFEPYARSLLQACRAAGVACEVSFCGHNGRTAAQMNEAVDTSLKDICGFVGKGLRRILQEDGTFDLVLIMAGTNDFGAGATHTEVFERVARLHEVCHECGAQSAVLAPPPVPKAGPHHELTRRLLVTLLRGLARRSERIVACVDPADHLPAREQRFWDPDGLHFSPLGSRTLGKGLAALAMEHLALDLGAAPRRSSVVPRTTTTASQQQQLSAPAAPSSARVRSSLRVAVTPASGLAATNQEGWSQYGSQQPVPSSMHRLPIYVCA